ncbi:Heat shock factor protein 1 like protein [Argiope bruennichi]|uniref:Heat shock factor protein 1 like protein n=1 Tax=Argiope bruennichi TaxID=94029 RepID=A0A8T0EQZ1_ARGBR|nr:Heat shock factor protein 1 like protein [Argiope bruennichi]
MVKSKRFQYKLWRVVNHCRSGAVKWSKTGDSIIFNFFKFQQEFLEPNDDFCKSNSISSFIRQLNLYGFRKLIDLSRANQTSQDEKEYVNPYFIKGRPDLLNQVTRKPLNPLMDLNVQVKKEVLPDEYSANQENMEFEKSKNKSNNVLIQGKTEASRRSNRKRKQSKFNMNEKDLEEEKSPEPRKRAWYASNIFLPNIDNDNSSYITKSKTEQINPFCIEVDVEEESDTHDWFKSNVFSRTADNNSPSTTRMATGQIDPIGFKIKKEQIEQETCLIGKDANANGINNLDWRNKNKLLHQVKESFPVAHQIKKELIEDFSDQVSETTNVNEMRKKIKISPRLQEKYRLDYKIRKESAEQEEDDIEILFETSYKNIAVSNWDDLLNVNGIPKFPEEEDVYYDKCLLEKNDLEWINKDEGLGSSGSERSVQKKKFDENRKHSEDIESLCVDMDMHANLSQKKSESIAKQVPTLASGALSSFKAAIGDKAPVKFLTPRRIEQPNPEGLKIILKPFSALKLGSLKQLEGYESITDASMNLTVRVFDEDDDPFFIHEEAKNIVLTQAIGTSGRHDLQRISHFDSIYEK